jgi:hypothetical protein
MKLDEFEQLLDRYGSEVGAWPAELADAGNALLGDSQDANRLRDQQAEVETVLARGRSHAAPAYLSARILANLPASTTPFEALAEWLSNSVWRAAATAMVPLIVGFGAGALVGGDATDFAGVESLVYIENLEELDFDEF